MPETPTTSQKSFFSRYDAIALIVGVVILATIIFAIWSLKDEAKRYELIPAVTLGFITLLALYVQLRINYLQWREMKNALARTDVAMQKNDRDFELTYRPILTVTRAVTECNGNVVTAHIKNSGVCPANDVYVDAGYYLLSSAELEKDPRRPEKLVRTPLGILGAGGETTFSCHLPPNFKGGPEENLLCLYGLIFGTSLLQQTFRTEFCLTIPHHILRLDPHDMNFHHLYNRIGKLISMTATGSIEFTGTATPTISRNKKTPSED